MKVDDGRQQRKKETRYQYNCWWVEIGHGKLTMAADVE